MRRFVFLLLIPFFFLLFSVFTLNNTSAQQCSYNGEQGPACNTRQCTQGGAICATGHQYCTNCPNCQWGSCSQEVNNCASQCPGGASQPVGGGGGSSSSFSITVPGFVKEPTGQDIFGSTINFITTILAIVGVVASIIWLLYGGIKYITAGGDKAAIEGAKTHIISALVGLIIVLFTFVIISLVFSLLGLGGLANFSGTIPTI